MSLFNIFHTPIVRKHNSKHLITFSEINVNVPMLTIIENIINRINNYLVGRQNIIRTKEALSWTNFLSQESTQCNLNSALVGI